jgi:hypothetical protein
MMKTRQLLQGRSERLTGKPSLILLLQVLKLELMQLLRPPTLSIGTHHQQLLLLLLLLTTVWTTLRRKKKMTKKMMVVAVTVEVATVVVLLVLRLQVSLILMLMCLLQYFLPFPLLTCLLLWVDLAIGAVVERERLGFPSK